MKPSLTTARYELLTRGGLSEEAQTALLDLLEREIGYPAPASLYAPFLADTDGENALVRGLETSGPVAPLPQFAEDKFTVALCLGHARSSDKGARSLSGVFEEDYNFEIIRKLAAALRQDGFTVKVYSFYQGATYGQAMRWLAETLRKDQVDLAVEFHFNSATPSAQGFEFLHWHKSTRGVLAAQAFQDTHDANFGTWQKNRGVEPLGDQAHERGVLFTSLTHCPALIAEPFFGSNTEEEKFFMSDRGREALISSYRASIIQARQNLLAA